VDGGALQADRALDRRVTVKSQVGADLGVGQVRLERDQVGPASHADVVDGEGAQPAGLRHLGHRETGRPGLVIVPGRQYQVMMSMVRRPAWTAGSASASCLASSSEPVR